MLVHNGRECSVLFCSLAVLDPRVGHTMDYFLHLSLSSVILVDSSTECPVHVLMLSIQAVRGLPRLHAPGIVKNPLICLLCCSRDPQNLSQSFHFKGVKTCFFILSESQLSHPYVATGTLALSLVVSSLKSVCCDFSAFSAVMPRSPALCLTWYGILSYTHRLL